MMTPSRRALGWWSLVGLLGLAGLGLGAAHAAPSDGAPAAQLPGHDALDEAFFPGLATRISLDLRGMDVVEVLKFLSSKGELNIVTGADVQGRVTLRLTDVSVRDALDIVLVSNGLALERRGTILYVMSGEAYEQLYGHRYGDPRESRIIQLTYANPGQVGGLLDSLKSSVGRLVIDETTATIAMLDTPTALAQMETLVRQVDLPTIGRQLPVETRIFSLGFANAEDVKPEIESALTEAVGQVRLDKRSNALIVTELPAKMAQIETIVKAYDTRHRQVHLQAQIVQVTLNDRFDTGIEWEWLSESQDFPTLNIVQSLPISTEASNPIKMIVGTLGENDVTATIKALHTFGKTEVLSSPSIAALNNEEAKILVGRREAFVTSTVTQAQSTATTAESVEFVDVGVKLFVTPTINDQGFVTMKIRPEVSEVADKLTTATTTIPIVQTSEAETTVMVKDGRTLVIGGLMKQAAEKSVRKVPLLGDLPVVGAFFRSVADNIEKTELVILVTPRLITGDELLVPSASTARVE